MAVTPVIRGQARGFEEVAKMLKGLSAKTQNFVITSVLKDEAKKLQKEIRDSGTFKNRTGEVRKSIKVRFNRYYRKYGEISFKVYSAWYITRFLEQGWDKERIISRTRVANGRTIVKKEVTNTIEGRKFFEEAYERNKTRIIDDFSKKTIDFMMNEVRFTKYISKNGR